MLGLNLTELFELYVMTPHGGPDYIAFPRAFYAWYQRWGVVVPGHAKLVLSFVLLVLGVDTFSSWVVTLIVGVVVVGAVGEVVVASG